jgi:hypothetical protein
MLMKGVNIKKSCEYVQFTKIVQCTADNNERRTRSKTAGMFLNAPQLL